MKWNIDVSFTIFAQHGHIYPRITQFDERRAALVTFSRQQQIFGTNVSVNNVVFLLQEHPKSPFGLLLFFFQHSCLHFTVYFVRYNVPIRFSYQKAEGTGELFGHVEFPAHWYRSPPLQVKVKGPVLDKLLHYDVWKTQQDLFPQLHFKQRVLNGHSCEQRASSWMRVPKLTQYHFYETVPLLYHDGFSLLIEEVENNLEKRKTVWI